MGCITCNNTTELCGICGDASNACSCGGFDGGDTMACPDCMEEKIILSNLPTPQQIAKLIKWPLSKWPGNCFSVATALVEHNIVKGKVVYGIWNGPIDPNSTFGGRPFTHHGWIETEGEVIVDPTRYVFEGKKPYIYVGGDRYYDAGGNELKASRLQVCPKYNPSKKINIKLPVEAKKLVRQLVGDKICINRLFWLANLPISMFKDQAEPIYKAIIKADSKSFIPIDNYMAVIGN